MGFVLSNYFWDSSDLGLVSFKKVEISTFSNVLVIEH
jgi:hypothetical protein